MTDSSSASSPLVLPPVSDALLERVVATILETPSEEPSPYRAHLDQFLATTPVRGFRKASSAPLQLRCDLVQRLFRRSPTAAFELLLLWRSLREDLAGAVRSGEEADSGSEIEREERELMAAVLAWEEEEPGPEEPGGPGDDVDPFPPAFAPAFELLRAIPATDPCWEEIETAVTELRTLAAGKVAGPERLRDRVRHSLEETIARRQELLTYFAFELAPSDLEGLGPEALAAAESCLPELDAVLERYLEVKGRAAVSVVEERQRRDQLGELEERIEELRGRWQSLGAPPPGDGPEHPHPPTPPGEPQPLPPDPLPPIVPEPGTETIEEPAGPGGKDETPPPSPDPIKPPEPEPGPEPIEGPTGPDGKDETPPPSPDPIEPPEPEPGPKPTPPVGPSPDPPQPPVPPVDTWAQLCWEMVGEGDAAGAYWLARSREARGEAPPIAPWLLAAVHASSRLEGISGDLVRDLRESIEAHALPDSLPEHLLALSAGLRGALVAPGSGLLVWVEEPARRLPALVPLAQAITVFAQGGKALGPEDAKGVRGLEAIRQQVSVAASAAKRAMDEATKRRFKLARASDLVNHLFRTELVDWLGAVARNETAKIAVVRAEAGSWRDRDRVMRRIGELDRQLHGNRAQRIVGDAREQILRQVGELCDRAEAWCDAVEQLAIRERKGDWYQKQVDQLRSTCEAALPAAVESLASLENHGPVLGGAARCLTLALGDLAALLAIPVAPPVRRVLAPVPPEGPRAHLEGLLAARLLSVPGAPIGGRIDEDPAALEGLDEALRRSRCLTLPEIIEQWLDRGDFRPVASLLDLCPEESRQALGHRAQAAQDDWRRRLRAKVEATRGQIEQALVDGVIGPAERSEHTSEVERLSGVDEPRPGPLVRRLEAVQASLGKRTAERVEELRQRWQLLAGRLPEAALTPEQESAISGLVEGALTRCDCRLAEELLAELPRILARQTQPPKTWFEKEEEPDSFREFLEVGRELETVAQRGLAEVVRELRTRGEIRGLRLRSNLPRPRVDEAVRGLEAWRNLKSASTPTAELAKDATAVLTYLGFNVDPGGVSTGNVGSSSLHLRVRMSAGGSAVTPEFGSQSGDRYDVVCVWERPPGETLAGLLDQLGIDARPVLVLYLARLTPIPRRRLFQTATRRLPAMLVVDEALMLHLVGELDSRLRTMMQCTLPYSSINPYTPFQPGEVPPEMFYGRREMLRELARAEGPCLLYGGRQLGKSALLRAVARKFHRPEREEIACVLDIKLLGDPAAGQTPEQLWPKLREALKDLNVLARQVSTDKAEDVLRHIREWLRKVPSRRLLLMLDEADHFLNADSRSGFRDVTLLRQLMTETQRRFKVVFTGLHNVQRFNGIPNQPLAHFGGLQIEPLEPDEAFRLVERPFRNLGFRFESREAILQVLSYTNYHPGLVQLFCKSLLDRIRGDRDAEPPHVVRLADIEAVYRDPKVQQEIRQRLDWTLQLDARYQAIAWSLVFDQMGSTDGFARAYPRAELLRLLRDNWPLGFGAVAFDDLTGLLDEMCGLGILVRDEQGRYRLRSPNLVRLMGTEEDVVQRLAELAKAPPPLVFDADSHHALLRDQAGIHSPFTHAMERQLAAQRSGVALVFASEALGLGVIPEALRRLRRDAGEGSLLAEIPGAIRSGAELSGFLREDLGPVGKSRYSYLYQRVGGQDPLFVERFREAVRACRSASRSAILRVVFLLDPDATFSWLEQPAAEREQLEEMADAVLSPHRWNEAGVRQWLEQRERVAAPDVIASVLGATGGWLPLLEVLGDRARGNADVVGAAELLGRDLDDSGSEQAASFQQKLGVEGFSDALEVLRTIHTLGSPGPLHAEDLTPDLVENRKLGPESLMAAAEFLVRMGVVAKEADGILRAEPVASRVLLR